MVCLGNPFYRIGDQQDHISFFKGNFCLGANILDEICRSDLKRLLTVLFAWIDAAGIDNIKVMPSPVTFGKQAVTRGSWNIINNSKALPNQAIEESTFAHVWSAYKHNYRFLHWNNITFSRIYWVMVTSIVPGNTESNLNSSSSRVTVGAI